MTTSKKGLFLNQHKYILDLLANVDLQHAKPVATPLDSKLKLALVAIMLDSPNYSQRVVGKLIYLTITRIDISFVVSLNICMHPLFIVYVW